MTQPPSYPGSGSGDEQNDPNQTPPQQPPYGQQPPQQPPYQQPGQYGDPNQQYGQPGAYGQYGQPGQPGQPYGSFQGANDAGKPNDGMSIAAFVLSLTCCLSWLGFILAFFGLRRTKGGQRRGRWAAVAALVIAPILTLVMVGGGILVFWAVDQIVTPDNAKVGQCVEIDESDEDNTIGMTKAECGDDHDAEIVAVEKITAETQGLDINTFCTQALSTETAAAIEAEGGLSIQGVTEDPPGEVGDVVVCYAEKTDGSDLTGKIG